MSKGHVITLACIAGVLVVLGIVRLASSPDYTMEDELQLVQLHPEDYLVSDVGRVELYRGGAKKGEEPKKVVLRFASEEAALGCVNDAVSGSCDNENACLEGMCLDGVCTDGAAVTCDDGNVCTDDSCDEVLGCQNTANVDSCDDGNACTENDVCTGGACTSGPAVDCDDGVPG